MSERKDPVEVIDFTPTWAGVLPLLLAAFEDGSPEARITAELELRRMAEIADSVNRGA